MSQEEESFARKRQRNDDQHFEEVGVSQIMEQLSTEQREEVVRNQIVNENQFENLVPNWASFLEKNLPVFIFPKLFELEKSVSALQKLVKKQLPNDKKKLLKIEKSHSENYNCSILKWTTSEREFQFVGVAINDSDIEFQANYVRLLQGVNCSQLSLILCGTCGSNTDRNFLDVFVINKAIKVDRGDLVQEGGRCVIRSRPEKIKTKEIDESHLSDENSTVLCSNYVMNIHNGGVFSEEYLSYNLFDMETYEFITISKIREVCEIACYRIVSDLYVGNNGQYLSMREEKKTKLEKEKKSMRKKIDMTNLAQVILQKLVGEKVVSFGNFSVGTNGGYFHDLGLKVSANQN